MLKGRHDKKKMNIKNHDIYDLNKVEKLQYWQTGASQYRVD